MLLKYSLFYSLLALHSKHPTLPTRYARLEMLETFECPYPWISSLPPAHVIYTFITVSYTFVTIIYKFITDPLSPGAVVEQITAEKEYSHLCTFFETLLTMVWYVVCVTRMSYSPANAVLCNDCAIVCHECDVLCYGCAILCNRCAVWCNDCAMTNNSSRSRLSYHWDVVAHVWVLLPEKVGLGFVKMFVIGWTRFPRRGSFTRYPSCVATLSRRCKVS